MHGAPIRDNLVLDDKMQLSAVEYSTRMAINVVSGSGKTRKHARCLSFVVGIVCSPLCSGCYGRGRRVLAEVPKPRVEINVVLMDVTIAGT
jgi:hypothetical protein